jgi:hypothetical protein
MNIDPNKLISDLIEMNNQIFLQHRYAQIDKDYEAQAAVLAQQLEAIDPDGTLSQQVKTACCAFIAEELRQHPPGSVDPYADLGPQPFNGPLSPEEIRALDPEDVFGVVGKMIGQKVDAGHELSAAEQTVYVLFIFDSEMQNGGFEQFILNSSGKYLPLVFHALEEVRAKKYASMLRSFVDGLHLPESELASAHCLSADMKDKLLLQLDPQQVSSFDDRYYSYYSRTPLSRMVGRFALRNEVFGLP